MSRFEIRRRRDEEGREFGAFLIFADGEPIGSPAGTLTAELIRQANAAGELRAALSALSERVESEVAYGDQWDEVRAADKLLDDLDRVKP